ncbi:MAG: hypothetical protein V4496_06845 [Pseudomonadota bacterium]
MKPTLLVAYAMGQAISKMMAATEPADARTTSTAGVSMSPLERGDIQPLIMRKKKKAKKALSLQEALLVCVDYLTMIATPARQFRAAYVIFDALYMASAADDDNLTPFRDFFFTLFPFTLFNMTMAVAVLAYHRRNNIPYKVTNGDSVTEFLETAASVKGTGQLIQNPSGLTSVSREDQWLLNAVAFMFAGAQIVSGVEDKPMWQGVAHSMHEAFGRPIDKLTPVTFSQNIYYGTIRFLHTSHVITILYSLADALSLLFQAVPFLANIVNANICAAPVAFFFLVSARFVLHALYSKKLPSWALRVAEFERVLYSLNNFLFALNAFAYLITLARLVIENQPDATYIYASFLQSLTVYVPSFLVAIAVFVTALREYNENFYNELSVRAKECGYDQGESDLVLTEFFSNPDNTNTSVESQVVRSFHNKEDEAEVNLLVALTRPLVVVQPSVSLSQSRDSLWGDVSLGSHGDANRLSHRGYAI